jgi:hypothetical protein
MTKTDAAVLRREVQELREEVARLRSEVACARVTYTPIPANAPSIWPPMPVIVGPTPPGPVTVWCGSGPVESVWPATTTVIPFATT